MQLPNRETILTASGKGNLAAKFLYNRNKIQFFFEDAGGGECDILPVMYTAIYKKVRSGYVAWLEEIPGVNTQGVSKKEAKENLADALSEFLLARRQLTRRERSHGPIVRERFALV